MIVKNRELKQLLQLKGNWLDLMRDHLEHNTEIKWNVKEKRRDTKKKWKDPIHI